jgi:hypothetical protein
MNECTGKHLLIDRVAEGEATPEEALELGHHLPGCTPCRIRLARAHRLNEMVGTLGEPVEVDEAFLQQVMDSLPEGPPPAREVGNGRFATHIRIVKILLTMSPLGLLGAGGRSLLMSSPGNFSRIFSSSSPLPAEGGPDILGSVQEVAGAIFAIAGKIGLTSGDFAPVKPVLAIGAATVSALPILAILLTVTVIGSSLLGVWRRRFSDSQD